MHSYDIIIIGAGPAGSSAAIEASRSGSSVLLVDAKSRIGHPVQCAEFIPTPLLKESGASSKAIVQNISGMSIYFPSGEVHQANAPGSMLDRTIFDAGLAANAQASGARLLTATRCIGVSKNSCGRMDTEQPITVSLRSGKDNFQIKGNVVIGADGPRSIVGTSVGEVNKAFVLALQHEIYVKQPLDHTLVFFDPLFHGGYGWLFPKGKLANVGVGITYDNRSCTPESLRKLQKGFLERLRKLDMIKGDPISSSGGLIPVGGPLRTVHDSIMIVGDAAGQTHSITGGGIPQAVICGRIAGKRAGRFIQTGDKEHLRKYDEEWKYLYGEELKKAYEKRKYMMKNWHDLETTIRKCWVTFGAYYE